MTKPRVALVAPPVNFLTELYGFRGRAGYRNQPPLGLGYLAATLQQRGLPVVLLDAAAEGWDRETTARRILSGRPDVIGVTAISFEAPAAYRLLEILRPRTDALLVLGGAHANAHHDAVAEECPQADAVVVGDGEQTLVEICEARAAGRDLEGIAGLRWRQPDGSLSPLEARPRIDDLDTLPFPAYDLFPHHRYRPLPHRRKRLPATCLITSRGCSYGRCTYCEMSRLSRKDYRRHSPARVVAEMERVQGITGAREIYFQDDIFVTDPSWVEEFCERLVAARLELIWSCESRFDNLPLALMQRMQRAGCWRIYFGFESGNQDLLDRIRKGFSLAEARDAARRANAAGLEVVGFFMLGLPGETPEQGRRTIEFSLTLGLEHAMYSLTVPHPGTELHAICEQDGEILQTDSYYLKRASYLPRGYASAEQLERLQAEAYRRFYLRPKYLWQCLGRVRGLEELRHYAVGAASLLRFLDVTR